jgi:hypothetical protein
MLSAWAKLSDGAKASLFAMAYRNYGDPDSAQFERELRHLTETMSFVVRSWPELEPISKFSPRDKLVKRLRIFWQSQTRRGVVPRTPLAEPSTTYTTGGSFIRDSVKLITGEDLTPDEIREAMRGRGRKQPRRDKKSP